MNYESLQLVNYDGESIPSGYLFGDISARVAITYLKSIGANDSAVEKIKEVEVNKILYGIVLRKGADDGLGATHIAMHDGKVYGGGNPMIPAAADEIKRELKGEELAEGWVVETVAEYQQQAGAQQAQAKPAARPRRAAPKPASDKPKAPAKPKVTPETTSDITPKGKNKLEVSLAGKKPNIALNMLTMLKRYSPKQADALEKFLLSGKKSTFAVDIEDIPSEIREELMSWVLNPERNFMEIHEKINRLAKVNLEYSDSSLSDKLRQKFGLAFSGDMYSVFQELDLQSMVEKGVIAPHQIEAVFPSLAIAMRTNMAISDGKLSDDFKLTKEMFVVPWDMNEAALTTAMSTVIDVVTSKAMTFSQFFNKYTSEKKGNQGPTETGKTIAPLFNLILSEPAEDVVDYLGKRLGNVNSTPEERASTIEMVNQLKTFLQTKAAKESGGELPTEDELKDSSFSGLSKITRLIIDQDFPGNKEPIATTLVDMIVAINKDVAEKGESFKYTPVKLNNAGVRGNLLKERVISIPTSDMNLNTDTLRKKLQTRLVKVLKAAQIISTASFSNKESSFLIGKASFEAAHEILGPWSGNFDSVDFIGFMRNPPLLFDKESGMIHFIDDDCVVHSLPQEASDKEKKEFATNAYKSLRKLISSDGIDSRRASYAMIAALKPSLATKFRDKKNSTDHLTDEAAHSTYQKTGESISSFITKMIDPIMGKRIQNGVGGPSLVGKAAFQEFEAANPNIHTEAIAAAMKGPAESAKFELELRKKVAAALKIDPSKLTVEGKKMESLGQIGGQMVKSYMTLAKYNATLTVLSDNDFVTALVSGESEENLRGAMASLVPGAHPDFLKDIKLPDMSGFLKAVDDSFKGHADIEGKRKACIDFMVVSIAQGSSKELERKNTPDEKGEVPSPLSSSQLSEIYENISSVGNFISQLAHPDYKDMKVFPMEGEGGGIDSLLETGSRLQLGKGDTPTHRFTMGTRLSDDKGSHIDAINSRVSSEGGVRRLSMGFLEFKFVSGGTRNAHLNATSVPMRDIVNCLDDYDEISLDDVLNVTNSIEKPSESSVFNINWNCNISASTKVSRDGIYAHARRMK